MNTVTDIYTRPNASIPWFHETVGQTIPSSYFTATYLDTGIFNNCVSTVSTDGLTLSIISSFSDWSAWDILEQDTHQVEYNSAREKYCADNGMTVSKNNFSTSRFAVNN